MGLREDILAFDDRRIEEVRAFGRTLYVRSISAHERDCFEAGNSKREGGKMVPNPVDIRARFCVLVLCDADGKRIFTDADVPALTVKAVRELDKVWAVASKLNAIDDEDVKELAGN